MSRVSFDNGSLLLSGKGTNFGECSPLTSIPVDRSYEVTVEAELLDQIEAGIMLFIGSSLYTGIGHDGTRVKMYLRGVPGRLQRHPAHFKDCASRGERQPNRLLLYQARWRQLDPIPSAR